MEKNYESITYMGTSYPTRILDIDGEVVQISVESLENALTMKDGTIAEPRIDDGIAYYVPDLCIDLPDEELSAALRDILNATGDPEMYFVVEDEHGIVTQSVKYMSLEDLVIANNIHGIKDTLTGMILNKKIKGDPKKHVFVKREVELLIECLQMCHDGEMLLHDGHHIVVHFGSDGDAKLGGQILMVNQQVSYTDEDIDDIMACALEGGINYWCNKASVVGKHLGNYASDQISRGGSLKIHLIESFDEADTKEYELNKEKFLHGLSMYLNDPNKPYEIVDVSDNNGHAGKHYIETCNVDATVADMIIQYALFNEIVFG